MPKISVIIPNYNHAQYLRQRLDSVFNQEFQDFEVIILDDNSKDNSKEIIEEYRHNPKVSHVIYNETNSGSPFKQWNKGFELAQGEYIWIAESDDWADSLFLKDLINFIGNNKSVSIAFSGSTKVFSNKQVPALIHSESTMFDGKLFVKKFMLFENSICNASAVIFRKDCLKSISIDYQDFKGSGDYLFWIYLCQQGSVAYVNKPLNYFRQHESNTTSSCIYNGTMFVENYVIHQYLAKEGYISKLAQVYISLFWQDIIKEKISLGSFSKQVNSKELINLWKRETKGFLKNNTFFFSMLFFIRMSPFSEHFFKKNPCLFYYKNYELLGILWKILHLPKTNFRQKQ